MRLYSDINLIMNKYEDAYDGINLSASSLSGTQFHVDFLNAIAEEKIQPKDLAGICSDIYSKDSIKGAISSSDGVSLIPHRELEDAYSRARNRSCENTVLAVDFVNQKIALVYRFADEKNIEIEADFTPSGAKQLLNKYQN